MSDVLTIFEDARDEYYIAWAFDGDAGARVGQSDASPETLRRQITAAKDREDIEFLKAELVAAEDEKATRRGVDGFIWGGLSAAQAALKRMKLSIADESNVPWPEWALTAKAAGWTAPKGWKP